MPRRHPKEEESKSTSPEVMRERQERRQSRRNATRPTNNNLSLLTVQEVRMLEQLLTDAKRNSPEHVSGIERQLAQNNEKLSYDY